ncbi:hypothetical protein D3C83_134240 [compost metagenome]
MISDSRTCRRRGSRAVNAVVDLLKDRVTILDLGQKCQLMLIHFIGGEHIRKQVKAMNVRLEPA